MGADGWHSLIGTFGELAGAAGTVNIPAGGVLLLLSVHASAGSATFQIFNGPAVAVINGAAPLVYQFAHTLVRATGPTPTASNQVVFTNTDHYYIQYIQMRN